MSTLTCPNPWAPSISRNCGELDSKASRVTALWLVNQTCAWPPCSAMRTSMGPSAGGLTCNLALVKLLSIISDTRSATPCPNSAVSTPAATFNVGGGDTSVEVPDVSNCAAPAVPSFDVAEIEESESPRECLSAAPAPAEAETACAMDNAVAALTAAVRDAGECVAAAAIACVCAALDPRTPCGAAPVSGVAKSSAGGEDCVVGAPVPCAMAAAMMACAAASLSADDGAALGVVPLRAPLKASALPSVEVGADVAAAMLALLAVGSMGLAAGAAFAGAAGTRAVGAGTPAALPDKTFESAAAAGPVAPGAGVMENPGGKLGAPAARLAALSAVKSRAAATASGEVAGEVAGGGAGGGAVATGGFATAAGGVESRILGWILAAALAEPDAATAALLAGVAGAASVLAGGGGVTAGGG